MNTILYYQILVFAKELKSKIAIQAQMKINKLPHLENYGALNLLKESYSGKSADFKVPLVSLE